MDHKYVNYLNELLSNSFVLNVKFHRYHWYIKGRNFFQLHEVFEDLYTYFADVSDELAERILMIEGEPLATMAAYLRESTIEEATADDTEEEIISQIIEDLSEVNASIAKTGIPLATEEEDEATLDMLISMQQTLEKYRWMFKAYQQ
ncbi:MAG TPA: Dps family protein [Bacillota bacterium]|nr:Dps family protein [Bacillota bacterium]